MLCPIALAREAAVLPVRLYKATLSRVLPPACRFEPSCSEYMVQAVRANGILRGSAQGVWRLLRCHPWGGSGYDPVKSGPDTAQPGPEPAGGQQAAGHHHA